MNEIEPRYVTFEQAKWLKEIGFNVPCQFLYVNGKYRIDFEKEGDLFNNRYPSTQIPIDWCLGPEQSQVVEWLRVNHGIWVYTRPVLDEDGEWIFKGYVKMMSNFKAKEYQTKLCREPQEAYSATFDYIKNEKLC
jgi:hypothetical protein